MRLDKMLANMGLGSRKDVRQKIKKGFVSINGKVIKNQGQHIDADKDLVMFNGEQINYREFIYIMLNKPDGVISATEDDYHSTVVDLLPDEYLHFEPFPVGRLDLDTVGLLLLTNDGKLAHELTAPKKEIEKVYYAHVEGEVNEGHIEQFSRGVRLEDGFVTKPADLTILKSDSVSEIELSIREGKFHQVKRMFQAINCEVIYLQRIKMGELSLDPDLLEGKCRELNEEEMKYCLSLKK